MVKRLSVSEKLLLAAYDIESRGHTPFAAEDLVVAAWQKYPETFGLAGYRGEDGRMLYPDSNRVFAEIMGSKPLRKRGWILKVGAKMYKLSESGLEEAKRLTETPSGNGVRKAALAREISLELQRLLASRAMRKAKEGRSSEITFYEACSFWNISPRSSAIALAGRLSNLNQILEQAQNALVESRAYFTHSGQSFGPSDLQGLRDLNDLMLTRFHEELAVIRKRTDERG